MPHERQNLLGAHGLGKGLGAVLRALAPVLVEVQLAVAVEVLERVAIHLDDLGGVHDAQGGAAIGVGHAGPLVLAAGLAGPLGLDLLAVRVDGVLVSRRGGQRVGGRAGGAGAGVAAGEADHAAGDRGGLQEVPSGYVCHVLLPWCDLARMALR